MLGRGLRRWPGKENCLVLDFTDKYHKADRTMDLRVLLGDDGPYTNLDPQLPEWVDRQAKVTLIYRQARHYTRGFCIDVLCVAGTHNCSSTCSKQSAVEWHPKCTCSMHRRKSIIQCTVPDKAIRLCWHGYSEVDPCVDKCVLHAMPGGQQRRGWRNECSW